ncbi:hypothetical protein T08_2674 [Trichinella sp. T8]|nr:hypothetical protein T08_2674 [Trichinella sp. T8]
MQKCVCCVKLEKEMHALLLLHCFLVPRPVIQRFVMAEHADLKFSSLLIMYDERHSTTWISTISIYAFINWEWKEEEYFIHYNSVHRHGSTHMLECQISKKGIHYSSIQGHLLYSHTSPSSMNCFALDEK